MPDAEFDARLRSLLEPERMAIPDAGFSERVLARLPAPATLGWWREAVLPGMTLAGCLLALVVLRGGEFLQELITRLPHSQWLSGLPIPWLILVYLLCATAVASVFQSQDELRRHRKTDLGHPRELKPPFHRAPASEQQW